MPAPARPYCPDHDLPLQAQTVSQMVDAVLALPQDTPLMVLAPVARERKGEFTELFAELQAQGYVRFRVDGVAYEFDDLPKLKKTEKHNIDVVIDRLKVRSDADQGRPCAAAPAAGREFRGGAADRRRACTGGRARCATCRRLQARRPSTSSTPSSPARCAVIRSPNSSRGCSRSTRRWAPARAATASARWNSSTRRGWWRFRP
jgi:hypothetical protein